MSDKYAALKQAAEKATPGEWVMSNEYYLRIRDSEQNVIASAGYANERQEMMDATFIAAANPATILELLAERDADKQRIEELEEMAGLQRDKIKRLESDLWDEQQLRKVHSQKSFELDNENRELKLRNDKDFVWRGEEIGRLNDEIDALKEKCAEAGISLKIEGE